MFPAGSRNSIEMFVVVSSYGRTTCTGNANRSPCGSTRAPRPATRKPACELAKPVVIEISVGWSSAPGGISIRAPGMMSPVISIVPPLASIVAFTSGGLT